MTSYKNDLLYNKLKSYYIGDKLKIFIEYVKYNKISLRVIDWFVTNYAKKNSVVYNINESNNNNNQIISILDNNLSTKVFNVYLSYKSQLKSFSKKNFDPFCRREKIHFEYINKKGDKDYILTTIGQLNFFRWAIDNSLIEYIKLNLETIELDMNKSIKNIHKNKKKNNSYESKRKKRQELSLSGSRGLNVHKNKIVLTFD